MRIIKILFFGREGSSTDMKNELIRLLRRVEKKINNDEGSLKNVASPQV